MRRTKIAPTLQEVIPALVRESVRKYGASANPLLMRELRALLSVARAAARIDEAGWTRTHTKNGKCPGCELSRALERLDFASVSGRGKRTGR